VSDAKPPASDTASPIVDAAQTAAAMSGDARPTGGSAVDGAVVDDAVPPIDDVVQPDAGMPGDDVRSAAAEVVAEEVGVDAEVSLPGGAAKADDVTSADHVGLADAEVAGVDAGALPVGAAVQADGVAPGDHDRSADNGVPAVGGGARSVHRRAFGEGQPDGVLPGDHRTADEVEAGIVALWRHYGATHDQGYRDRLMLHYAPLVKYVAGRVGTGLPAHVDVADLVQSGIFGLADAIEKFEPERGLKFETYAMQRIRGAILDELRSQDWVPRSVRGRARDVERALERLGNQLQRTPTDSEIATELQIGLRDLRDLYAQFQLTSVVALDELMVAGRGDASLAETLPDEAADDPVARLVDQVNRRQLADAIAQLGDRDRVVVTLYYFENLTLAEIGRVLGVTESRVCQLHTRAVLRLRTKLAEHADA
jgi:RNA polymerase sigma factor for flagellar operon FliA